MTPKNEKFEEIKKYLIGRDKKLSILFESFEIAEKKKSFSNFQNLIRIIVGQQLSGAAAKTIFSRLLGLVGNNFSPTTIAKLTAQDFSEIGVSRAKANYCQGIADILQERPDYFDELQRLNDQEKIAELTKLRGIGIWTASIFVMSSDIFSDVFAYGDATLNKVIKNVYGIEGDCFDRDLERILYKWSPHKTLVCNVIWHYNDNVLTQIRNRI